MQLLLLLALLVALCRADDGALNSNITEDEESLLTPKVEKPLPKSTSTDFTLNGGFNYAGLDAGAVIMASNKESKGTNNLLNSDPDKYSLSPTAAWWFVIGLSEEILVTSFVIANLEKYSSSVKRFSIHASHTFYADGSNTWTLLGEFERPHHRGTDSFLISQPKWARYLKFQVLSTHGKDVYCTLTSIRVYGQTTIETLREDLALLEPSTVHATTTAVTSDTTPGNNSCLAHDFYSVLYLTTSNKITNEDNISASESPFTDVSLLPPPSPAPPASSSMDNIFKTLMEKVKTVEAELAVLKQENSKLKRSIERITSHQQSEPAKQDQQVRDNQAATQHQYEQLLQRTLVIEQLGILAALLICVWELMLYCR